MCRQVRPVGADEVTARGSEGQLERGAFETSGLCGQAARKLGLLSDVEVKSASLVSNF